MQIFVKQRATLEGAMAHETPAIDVSGSSLLVHTLVVYNIAGTSPSLIIQPQTSDDLETWDDFGTSVSLSAAGQSLAADDVKTFPFGRYMRYKITFSVTGTPSAQYSVILNTHASS